jgi:MFS family permease
MTIAGPGGLLADRIGRRATMVAGLVLGAGLLQPLLSPRLRRFDAAPIAGPLARPLWLLCLAVAAAVAGEGR